MNVVMFRGLISNADNSKQIMFTVINSTSVHILCLGPEIIFMGPHQRSV